jgi:hypothetical protein
MLITSIVIVTQQYILKFPVIKRTNIFSIHGSPVHVHKRILLAAILTWKHNTVKAWQKDSRMQSTGMKLRSTS